MYNFSFITHNCRVQKSGKPFLSVALPAFLCLSITAMLSGCASTEETDLLKRSLISNQSEFVQFKQETEAKLSKLTKEQEALSKQVLSMHTSVENRDDKIKNIMGKLDELEHQLRTYWAETKSITATRKKPADSQFPQQIPDSQKTKATDDKPVITQTTDGKYEDAYKDAFETYQKGQYDEAIKRFSAFLESHGNTPLASNAYYWIGESHMNQKNYEKAILYFQEVIDKHPKSEKAPRALLTQAEAFRLTNDKKSSITILKRVIELYPKTEEARLAERRLRSSGL